MLGRFLPDVDLPALGDRQHATYAAADPFPHIVLDDFLPAELAEEVLAEFPSPEQLRWWSFDSPQERKLATADDAVMGSRSRELFSQLNSARAIDFLERLTGIAGLLPDPHLYGGGLHQIERGGFLKVHADFNIHPRTGLQRRLNLLVYLNHDWAADYGGALELWNRDMTSCRARIAPVFNRCVIFTTSDSSFHGHPEPLTCPPDRTRKSIALYYYSLPDGLAGLADSHNTLFQARSDDAHLPPAPRLAGVSRASRWVPPVLMDLARRARARRGGKS